MKKRVGKKRNVRLTKGAGVGLKAGTSESVSGRASVRAEPAGYSPPAPLEAEILEPAPVGSTLTTAEQEEFARCEEKIRRGWQSFVEVGDALIRIHDQKLYRDQYERFEDYYRAVWQYQKSQVYRLMGAAKVVNVLSPIGEKSSSKLLLPASEAQVRPLVGLEETVIKQAWRKAIKEAGGDQITARLVQKQVRSLLPPPQQRPKPTNSDRSRDEANHVALIAQALNDLVEMAAKYENQRAKAVRLQKEILRLLQLHGVSTIDVGKA